MNNTRLLKNITTIIIVTRILFYPAASYSQIEASSNTADWNTQESRSFIIYYRPAMDLKALQRKLSARTIPSAGKSSYSEIDPLKEVCDRLDTILDEVKGVLGMYPAMDRVKIKIFQTNEELDETHLMLLAKKEHFRAFYVHKYNTIYTSLDGIADSVMIHEMAHVVTDNYFSDMPPDTVREMIASYVDAHFAN